MVTQPEPEHNSTILNLLVGVATLITSFGVYLFKKLNRTPPKHLAVHDYRSLKSELSEELKSELKSELKIEHTKDLQETIEMLRTLSASIEGDVQSMKGALNQMNKRLSYQGGVLKILEERLSSL